MPLFCCSGTNIVCGREREIGERPTFSEKYDFFSFLLNRKNSTAEKLGLKATC